MFEMREIKRKTKGVCVQEKIKNQVKHLWVQKFIDMNTYILANNAKMKYTIKIMVDVIIK